MTIQEQTEAIAVFCGYYKDAEGRWHRYSGAYRNVPSYTSDLNAMHEAEKSLNPMPTKPDEKSQTTLYRENLCIVTIMKGGPITSPAHLRAEAFLKTINKWKE
jgi:hypothetical protein